TTAARNELQRLGKTFKSPLLKNVCIKIDGHTDEQGWPGRTRAQNDSLNEDLSLKRVTSVRDYLKSIGVDTTRIVVQGYGRRRPRIPKVDSTFANLAKARRDSLHRTNRRVEIYLIKQRCPDNTCTINTLASCPTDTLKIVNPGDRLKYVFTVENHSQFPAHNVEIQDLLPEHIKPAITTQLTNGGRHYYSTTIPLLRPNSTETIELLANVDATIPDTLLELVNSATLNAENDINCDTSSDTVYVIGGQPPNIEPVATNVRITGTPRVGKVLTGNYAYYDPDRDPEGASTYRWLRNGRVIPNATAKTYRLDNADLGYLIRFEVTPIAQGGTSPGRAATSSRFGPIMPDLPPVVNYAKIIGTPAVDSLLRVDYVTSDPDGDATGNARIQWLRNGKPIPGGAFAAYKVRVADAGTKIAVQVTPVSQTGLLRGTPFLSDAVGPIPRVARVQKPRIKGLPQVGKVLQAKVIYEPFPGLTLKFQWWRRRKEETGYHKIPGKTLKTYELSEDDKGSYLKCSVIPILNGQAQAAQFSKEFGPLEPRSWDIFN
ncbi:MAG: OmpA family protein, partial [bacterium]